jgi:hypothetical protein
MVVQCLIATDGSHLQGTEHVGTVCYCYAQDSRSLTPAAAELFAIWSMRLRRTKGRCPSWPARGRALCQYRTASPLFEQCLDLRVEFSFDGAVEFTRGGRRKTCMYMFHAAVPPNEEGGRPRIQIDRLR